MFLGFELNPEQLELTKTAIRIAVEKTLSALWEDKNTSDTPNKKAQFLVTTLHLLDRQTSLARREAIHKDKIEIGDDKELKWEASIPQTTSMSFDAGEHGGDLRFEIDFHLTEPIVHRSSEAQ